MTNFHQDLDYLKKSMKIQLYLFMAVVLLAVVPSIFSYKSGYNNAQIEVIQRAKQVVKPAKSIYTIEEVEYIVFNAPQQ